jgi:hypothetical protein
MIHVLGLFSKDCGQVESMGNKLTAILKNIFQGKKLDESSIDGIPAICWDRIAHKNNPRMRELN